MRLSQQVKKSCHLLQYNSNLVNLNAKQKYKCSSSSKSTAAGVQTLDNSRSYFSVKQQYSNEVNYLICKHYMVDINFDLSKYKQDINELNHHIQNVLQFKNIRHIVSEWINSLLFNIVALNHEYKEEISSSISSVSENSCHQASIELIDSYDSSCKQAAHLLFNLPAVATIVQQIQLNPPVPVHQMLHRADYTLLSSLNYLSNKLSIETSYSDLLATRLSALSECDCSCAEDEIDEQVRSQVNLVLFGLQGQQYKIQNLQSLLNKSYNLSLLSLASLVDANYYRYEVTRPIFNGCSITGNELMTHIIKSLICSSTKNELFSESMQQGHRLFQLFMTILEYRSMGAYAYWVQIVSTYLRRADSRDSKQETLVKIICNYLRRLPTQHQEFVSVLRLTTKELVAHSQCSQTIALQIVKKLMLNRFLLNPTLFYNYSRLELSNEHLNASLNHIRLYFYPKKAQIECHKKYSSMIQSILVSIVQLNKTSGQSKSTEQNHNSISSKHVTYKLDRSLHQEYRAIAEEIPRDSQSSHHKKDKSMSSQSYSLSFSFVKNNFAVSEQAGKSLLESPNHRLQTPRIRPHVNPQNVPNIHTTVSKNENIGNILSPTSAKSNKTNITDIPVSSPDAEMLILEQLLTKRRALCHSRNLIDQRKSKRAQQRQKMAFYFTKAHSNFRSMMRELQCQANKVKIDTSQI